jgi:opacity protein-like surface antigen
MKRIWLPMAILAIGLATPTQAQLSPFSIEGRAGVAVPTGDAADALKTGFSVGANPGHSLLPLLDLYAGYSLQRFGFDDDEEFGDVDADATDSGFSLGARIGLPVTGSIAPWLFGGVLLHQVEIEGREGNLTVSMKSDRSVGFEVGGGVSLPIAPLLSLTPAVRYRRYTADFDFAGETWSEDVTYFAIDLGVRLRF